MEGTPGGAAAPGAARAAVGCRRPLQSLGHPHAPTAAPDHAVLRPSALTLRLRAQLRGQAAEARAEALASAARAQAAAAADAGLRERLARAEAAAAAQAAELAELRSRRACGARHIPPPVQAPACRAAEGRHTL